MGVQELIVWYVYCIYGFLSTINFPKVAYSIYAIAQTKGGRVKKYTLRVIYSQSARDYTTMSTDRVPGGQTPLYNERARTRARTRVASSMPTYVQQYQNT